MIYFVIFCFIIITVLAGIVFFFPTNKNEKETITEMKDNREELEILDKKIITNNEQIKKNLATDGKNETDSDLLNSFKNIKL